MRSARRLIWAVAVASLVSACSVRDSSDAVKASTVPTTQTGSEAVPATVSSTSIPTLETRELSTDMPRWGRYGFLDIALTRATLGRVEPRTYLTGSFLSSQQNHVFLTLELSNLSERGDAANWPSTPYGLTVLGEPVGAPVMLDGRPHIGLPALASDEAVLAFVVPDEAGFDDLTFTLALRDSIPLELPLTGPMPEHPWPVTVDARGEGPAQGGAHGCNQSLTVEVRDASVSIDLLETEKYPTAYGRRRALVGDRFLTVHTLITNHGGSRCGAGATNIDSNSVRLEIDGRPTAPITAVALAVPPNVVEEVTWHFAFPVGAAALELVFGSEEGVSLRVPVDISSTEGL